MLIISAAGDYSLRCSSFSSDLARLEGKRLRVQTRGDLGRVYASSQGLRSFVPGLAEGKVDKKKKRANCSTFAPRYFWASLARPLTQSFVLLFFFSTKAVGFKHLVGGKAQIQLKYSWGGGPINRRIDLIFICLKQARVKHLLFATKQRK